MEEFFSNVKWADTIYLIVFGFTMVISLMALFVIIMLIFKQIFKERNAVSTNNANEKSIENIAGSNATDFIERERVAIAVAIAEYYNEVHDDESYKLTFKRKDFTPWNL